MARLKRRTLLKATAATGLATSFMPSIFGQANDVVGVAILGSGRGTTLAHWFSTMKESQVVAVCDVDRSRGEALANKVAATQGKRPDVIADYRHLLDRNDVDALAVATPEHWHAPITINACMAGKDVYVEKPCSHNVVEGRLMVEAARKYKRIVQVGSQLRSAPHYQEAWDLLRKGEIGNVLMIKAINNQRRKAQSPRKDELPPDHVDYDMWLGPAPDRPFNHNRFHGSWRWYWDYGSGDVGNDGVHQIDLGRWALNLKAPKAVSCSGGKLGWRQGVQETPDTMVVTWEYDNLLYVFEQRDFTPYRMQGHHQDNDNIFFGDEGYMMIDRDGYRVFHTRGEPGRSFQQPWAESASHYQNFIECIKTRQQDNLRADIEEGHYSAVLCHLGNAAYRTGRRLEFDAAKETFLNDHSACEFLSREYRKGYELPTI